MWAPHGPRSNQRPLCCWSTRATVHCKITDITLYYVLALYSKFNATCLNIYSICESLKARSSMLHMLITFALLPALIACFWRWTFCNPPSQHCSCPPMHAEAFVCGRWQAFTTAQILPIPREEDTRIHPSSAEILERAAVFSQPSNGWHVFLKTGRWSRRGKASTPQSAFCHRLMLDLLILLNKYRGIVLISKTDK